MGLFEVTEAVVLAAFALTGGIWDARFRTIPNMLCLTMAVAGLAFATIGLDWLQSLYHALHMLAALLVGMGIFALRWWGGGDAKFYAAGAAWFPISGAFMLVFWVSVFGLLLVIFSFVARSKGTGDRSRWTSSLPYGISIAGGLLVSKALAFV